jgi:protein-S-isoprenylcysteine O-methyltransferase Ste14
MLNTVALLTIFVSAPVVFALLFFFTAPYGRHFREGWGPSVTARGGWIVMEAPALLVIGIIVVASGRSVTPLSLLLLGLWEIHYLYRTCLFPILMRGSRKRFPIMLIGFAFVFNSLNGYANGTFLAATGPITNGGLLSDARICAGIALFAAGFLTHVWADRGLRRLRKPGEIGYKIPRGGLFEYVSSPNYLGEITQWCGWALATWSLPGLAFAVFTVANLVPRAWANRRWYMATFPGYPPGRRSVIPFLF